ncbi:CFAP77 [Symbiodinium sp. CCMP2456]|nr:CFAP77 [Symbiodinium sp. CCMP2456]
MLQVRDARDACLAGSSGVTLKMWIDRRIGGEIAAWRKNGRGDVLIGLREVWGDEATAANREEAGMLRSIPVPLAVHAKITEVLYDSTAVRGSLQYRNFIVINPVIAKDDIGRAKHSCYTLPPDNHAYGRACPRDPQGAREVLSAWVPHHPTAAPQDLAQDFRAINKSAAKKGVRTVKQMTAFRKAVDIRLHPRAVEACGRRVRDAVDTSATYGRANLPSTPMQDVLKGAFASEFQSELSARYDAYAEINALDAPNGKHRIRTTKAQSLRVHSARQKTVDPKPLRPVRDPFKLVSNRTQLQPLTAREARRGSELAEQLEAEPAELGPVGP